MATDDQGRGTLTIREEDDLKVTPIVRATAAWTWRLLLIGAGLFAIGYLFKEFEDIFVPIALALLFTALLCPMVDWLVARRVPRIVAVLGIVIAAALVLLLIGFFVIEQFVKGAPEMVNDFTETVRSGVGYLRESSLHVDEESLRQAGEKAIDWAKHHGSNIASGAVGTAGWFGGVLTGSALALFLTIFFLYEGRSMWDFVAKIFPSKNRDNIKAASAAGFQDVKSYVHATVIVALIDALVIGIGLVLLGIPLAVPLTLIIFLGSFIPVVGSFAAGTIAVFIALVTEGWVKAVIVLALLVFVMAFEGHVLQPFLLGKSVSLHPVAVILAIAIGIGLTGIVGGLLAVPILAFFKTAFSWKPGDDDPDSAAAAPPPDEPEPVAATTTAVKKAAAKKSPAKKVTGKKAAADE